MGNSKKWLILISVSLVVLITTFLNLILLQRYRLQNQDNYLAAIIDKIHLLENTPSPKIIIIGGSNAAFGFDSQILRDRLGMPVVNTGLQGGVGIRFAMNVVKPYVREGDIILLSPEYHNILGELHGGEILAQTLILYPNGIRFISSINEVAELLKSFPNVHTVAIKKYLEGLLREDCPLCNENDTVYYRHAFDPETGDITTNTKDSRSYVLVVAFDYSVPNDEMMRNIRFFNTFSKYVDSKNAHMLFVFPSIVKNYDDNTKTILLKTETLLEHDLEFPLLDSLDNSQFSSDLMFDTPYHLNNEGRTIRSNVIANKLCVVLNLSCP
jgi:hypothetical protein